VATPEPRPGPTQQRPVGAQRGVGAAQHRAHRLVVQAAERTAKRPPHRLAARDQLRRQALLIQPQPHERIRRGRQPLDSPRPLPRHRDELLTVVDVRAAQAQQLGGASPGRYVERQDRPVTGRRHRREQLVEQPVWNGPRLCLRYPLTVSSAPRLRKWLQRIVVGAAPAAAAGRHRVPQRPGPQFPVELIESADHSEVVVDRRRSEMSTRIPLARTQVETACRRPAAATRPPRAGRPHPQHEIADLPAPTRHLPRPGTAASAAAPSHTTGRSAPRNHSPPCAAGSR
jgi:hypothetical protein